jgi:predicted amidohydrolase
MKAIVAIAILASILIALGMVMRTWLLAITRKAHATMNSGDEYRRLADEYRRLAEMAVTAQEHTDLKLGDMAMQIGQVRDQLESVQRILKDVE